ncbi:hypothetical protein GCM10009613_43860 [Pseudonocardia kongjuensis]|uniref:Uncharacterized protein n=1 Tax=Pseudonocardia kongjuensis TaxID=102227 RepID=A0ABN1Y133_9PSEU
MPEPQSHRESGQHVIEHALDLLSAADRAKDYTEATDGHTAATAYAVSALYQEMRHGDDQITALIGAVREQTEVLKQIGEQLRR